jgi:hypothetical protein
MSVAEGLRILHAPVNVADQAGAVVRSLRRLGHDAELWEYGSNRFSFPTDRSFERSKDPATLWPAFLEAIERFDVLHFHFARSLFPRDWWALPPYWDLPVYRMLGKKVFYTFHGSDIRIRRIHEQVNPWSFFRHGDIETDDERTEKAIAVCRTYADRLFVVAVDYLHFVPDATLMPRVIDLAEWPAQAPEQREIPTILHMPSHRGKKGTDIILRGLRKLESEGVRFDLRLVENVSHADARAAIESADIVVDNVLTGDYEVVSIETMSSSRVAVANVAATVREAFPEVPVVGATPDTFSEEMRSLIADLPRRRSLAERGRPFVARVHDSGVVARELLTHYRADYPRRHDAVMPGWISQKRHGEIERLEEDLREVRTELARTRRREQGLVQRGGGSPQNPRWRRRLRTIAAGIPARLGGIRARLGAALRRVTGRPRRGGRRRRGGGPRRRAR